MIVITAEVYNNVEVARIAITFRRVMGIVKVCGNRRHPKATVHVCLGKPIDVPGKLRHAVVGLERRSGTCSVSTIIEAPNGLARKVGGLHHGDCLLRNLIEPGWHNWEPSGIQLRELVAGSANLPSFGVRAGRGRGAERCPCVRAGYDRKWLRTRCCRRAG